MGKNNRAQLFQVDFNHFQKFQTQLHETAGSEKTAKGYLQDVKQFDEFLMATGGSLNDLTRVDIQNYMKHLEKLKRFASTIARHYATITKLCHFIGRPELDAGIHKREKQSNADIAPKTLKKKELLRIFRIVERLNNVRSEAIFKTLAYTGMRIAELHSLDRRNLKRGGLVKVIGKRNKERMVPLSTEARNAIEAYLKTREDDHPALFLSNKGGRMAVRTIQELIDKVEKLYNAEVEEKDQLDLHAQLFRHTFATVLVKDQKKGLGTVADILGHEDLQTTRRYAKDSLDDVAEDLDGMTLI
ncbi:tyrosine-type recombinase/integrase [Neobacillus pocheonensis]|uniref:Tyrosine-type recombinase/integrase n=1 Tax=Neobacillus pocheonensis TaxID=363869 RepID=A0ABT0WFW6_9BACI|nr:tyrosine-type recombinase/integrase [Neobacillus pocheonensis]